MAIIYQCRHCNQQLGSMDEEVVDTSTLGINSLSHEERKTMIQYKDNGDVHIQVICENCQEALDRNPDFHELDTFIQ
ncbi:anti-sigma-F factor Fin family protein [Bacillaceae bacterium S4-13-58]